MCSSDLKPGYKKCDPCGKNPLANVFVLLGLQLPFHQGHMRILVTLAFTRRIGFTAKWKHASRAVSVHTAEYIIRRTLRISSHLFMGNSHFPLDPPENAHARLGKVQFAIFSSRVRQSALFRQCGTLHTSPCFYTQIAKPIRLKWAQKR